LAASLTHAQSPAQQATLSTALNYKSLQAGQQAVLAVVLDIKPGFHAQSHKPLDPNLIAYTVTAEPNPQADWSDPIYPPGKLEEFPALGKISVYEDKVIVYIPVQIKKDAPVGSLTLKGHARYQICNDRVCFAPVNKPFEVSTQIIPPGQPLEPNEPDLFKSFDPKALSKSATINTPNATLFGLELTQDSYALAFFGAIVVGMIFNVMPCVLPIVPLKAMGFYQAAQERRGRSIALGAVFSAGIIATFGALAVIVVVLRVFAWGELFANPWFAAAIVIILLALALGTFGFFGVVLPSKVYEFAPKHDTYIGNFLFGILTAILSTPCTFGMFLGLLVWASLQSPVVGTSLVMAVGFGMAVPYLILAAVPELARRFPRTGPWAEIVKQMMGFLLLGTAIYFARRFLPEGLAEQGFWWLLFAVVAASGAFLVIRTLQFTHKLRPVIIASVIAVLLISPALAITLHLTYVPVEWVKYTPEAFASAVQSGKPVLIDFTAKWCGNCQAIEATVYVDQRTVDLIKQKQIIPFKADLTDSNAAGWELLRSLHPVGAIPFTAIYLPGQSDPRKLAGIYSTAELLQTFGV
jgi:thiol:disulfide interchange protein DsbD